MTQPTLTNLAQRGALCKPWAEWCNLILYQSKCANKKLKTLAKPDSKLLERPSWERIGPLPSCTYLDDQLGEFLDRAGVVFTTYGKRHYWLNVPGELNILTTGRYGAPGYAAPVSESPLDRLNAAIILVERAHRLGEYAHYSETEAEPYMAAFLRGIGG